MSTEDNVKKLAEDATSNECELKLSEIPPATEENESKLEETPATKYRWCYQDQHAFEEKNRKKSKKKGLLLYAAVMSAAFLICFGILLGTIVWYGDSDLDQYTEPLTSVEVFELVAPSTVFIRTYKESKPLGEGSGFFVRDDGYIATNYHVIENATSIQVYLQTGKNYVATVVGSDRLNDLAVLKIDGSSFPVAVMGNSDELRVGEPAIVIGNPSGANGSWTITEGIVSALNRNVSTNVGNSYARQLTVIQFDAAVNPGNSGGPLCNSRGEIVGVVTLKLMYNDGNSYNGISYYYEGMSYAIPINHALFLIDSMI